MSLVDRQFVERVSRIPYYGLGLSVDVYSPDLLELAAELARRGLPYGYLEVFKAASAALESIRRHLADIPLPYHGEGLWVTQPNPEGLSPFGAELDETVEQLRILDSPWVNHECAAKQMGGYAFGTYLPALFTEASAEVTADNVARVQERLDRSSAARGGKGPLFLLETPPLTYVGFGDLGLAEFFHRVTDRTPCGVVLDVGHLWTVYRYSGAWRQRTLTHFMAELLDAFPLGRVVEIHVAGLAPHPSLPRDAARAGEPPLWLDAHGAPIPDVLMDLLEQVLDHQGLVHLKGVALEVDTKPIPQIVQELSQARARFGPRLLRHEPDVRDWCDSSLAFPPRRARSEAVAALADQYDRYARIVTGQATNDLPVLGGDASALPLYTAHYLPYEILQWGGTIRDMFPETCRSLDQAEVALDEFVRFWFREPRASRDTYDFFRLKVARFVEFVREVHPAALAVAEREAEALQSGYALACEPVEPVARAVKRET